MRRTAAALNLLWDEQAGLFFSRDARTGKLLRAPTSASLLALYSGAFSDAQGARLIGHLTAAPSFAPAFPVPSVPVNDPHFEEGRFWAGPTWVNVNWHLIDGARRAGEHGLAARLRDTTLRMIATSGFYEYFSPLDGRGLGAKDFSWTAALTLDLLNSDDGGAD
jgi:neutral trehalase